MFRNQAAAVTASQSCATLAWSMGAGDQSMLLYDCSKRIQAIAATDQVQKSAVMCRASMVFDLYADPAC